MVIEEPSVLSPPPAVWGRGIDDMVPIFKRRPVSRVAIKHVKVEIVFLQKISNVSIS